MKTILTLAALAAAFAVAPASAQTASVRSQTVAVADIDLASPSGAARLDRRIHRAAVDLCGTTASFDVRGRNAIGRCVIAAKTAAAPARDRLLAARSTTTGVTIAAR